MIGHEDMLARYQAAEAVLDTYVAPLVLNEGVSPNWVGGGAFWYRRQRAEGGEYLWVEHGAARPAFDHAAIAAALGGATGRDVGPWSLAVESVAADGAAILCLDDHRWRIADGQAIDLGAIPAPPRGQLLSPAGDQALIARDHDLYLVDLASGAERRLTDDGEENFAWGKFPDAALLAIARRRSGMAFAPFGWSWSPDGRYLVGGRVDERHIEPYPFLESVPLDGGARPRAHDVRQALLGEQGPIFSGMAIEVATGRKIPIELRDSAGHDLGRHDLVMIEPLDWAADHRRLFVATVSHSAGEALLLEIDVTTGRSRIVIAEAAEGRLALGAELYRRNPIRILADGARAIWFSERSGFGHLYLYDVASSAPINPITAGDWLVRDILAVDEARGRIWFTASGRDGGNPYERRVYRVDLDGRNLTLLSPEPGDHAVGGEPESLLARVFGMPSPASPIAPDFSVFVDSWSTVSAPSVTVLRSAEDGAIVRPLETADASALYATGWRPPEPFVARAADGVTDLHGVIYRPRGSSGGAVPVIDAIYGGPQLTVVPHNFAAGRVGMGHHSRAAFAALGFAVVVIDGRATPLRSKPFQDAGHGAFADTCLDDHVAVLAQLCAGDPTLDGDRIGIYGHSFGGYTAARAILRHPDMFKVAVASAGGHNFQGLYFAGGGPLPDYGGGLREKPHVAAVPDNYRQLDNGVLAANLRGRLMLVYGDLDENAFPAVTLQLCDALNRANRSYDLLYLANGSHFYTHQPYFLRRLWDYFVAHLMGQEPPRDYSIGALRE